MGKKKIVILMSVVCVLIFLSGCNMKELKNYRWCTNVIHAIEEDDISEVENLLTEKNKDINIEGNVVLQWVFGSECSSTTPFEAAIVSNNLEIMKDILNYDGVRPFSDEFNPVSWVIHSTNDGTWKQRHEIVELMFQRGFDPDFIPISGESTLCGIAGERVVYDGTNDYNSERAKSVLALYQFAVEQCDTKKQVDTPDKATPIHTAIGAGNLPLIKYLIDEMKYSVNQETTEGETPLVYFAKYILPYDGATSNATEIIEFCKIKGADLSIKDVNGKTAYDYAMESGSMELAELLKGTL